MTNVNFNKKIQKDIVDFLTYDKDVMIEDVVKLVFETLLKCERSEYLNNTKEPNNKANGYYNRMIKGMSEYFEIKIPRDRLGLYKPVLLQLLKRNDDQMRKLSFMLYTKGLTTRDISDVLGEIYNKELSATSISNITKEFEVLREDWIKRNLENIYYFIYIDAIHINVRRDTVEKEAFYTVLGVKKDLTREVLGVYNIPQESAGGWEEVLIDLKTRGLKYCLMFICDELSGLFKVLKKHFPNSKIQSCVVHKKRNILNKVRSSDKEEIAMDLNKLFVLENPNYTSNQGEANVEIFLKKWKKKYPRLKNCFKPENIGYYFGYTHFSTKIQRMIYTTNWIERLNKSIRRTEKIRNSFPSPDSALNFIVACIMDVERKTYSYPVTSFLPVKYELDEKLESLIGGDNYNQN